MNIGFSRKDFPNDFEFGVATSAYQIEGSDFGDCGRSQWDDFAATPNNVIRKEHGGIACDHYHHWEEDLDLIKAAGFDAYRFSTSWARVIPDGHGQVNPKGLDFYDRLVDGLLERGIKPYITLYHWELPSALLDKGGWRNRDIAFWFAEFSKVISQHIGDRVTATSTFNEPWCVTFLSHFYGIHAPGTRDIRATARSMHHVLLAHGEAIKAMRSQGVENLGVVLNLEHATPVDDSPEAEKATALFDGIFNRWFLGGIFKQAYPQNVLDELEAHLPLNYQDDLGTIAQPLDWLGVNYYSRSILGPSKTSDFPQYQHHEGPLAKTAMNWEIYPEGLHYLLKWAKNEYSGDLPIYITENGMAAHDELKSGAVNDTARIDFLNQHFAAAKHAIDDGVPLKGYFIWSLLDNFEWALGYDKRFGLVHVDFDTLKRTPKASYLAIQSALGYQTT